MKGLKTRLTGVLAVSFLALALLAYLMAVLDRASEARRDALQRIDHAARTLGAILGEQFSGDRHAPLAQEAVRGAALAHKAKVMVVGATGRILASQPPRPPYLRPAEEPDCAECHLKKAGIPATFLAQDSGGRELALAFSPIPRGPVCLPCHPGEGAIGYVYLQMPLKELAVNPFAATLPLLLYLLLTMAVLLVAVNWVVSAQVLKPLAALKRGIEEEHDDAFERLQAANVPAEFRELSEAARGAKSRWRSMRSQVEAAVRGMGEARDAAQADLKALRANLEAEARVTRDNLVAMSGLGAETDDILGMVEGVADSVSDNAESFSGLSLSVDDVARDAAQLSEKVVQMVESASAMSRSVHSMAEHMELLSNRADAAKRSMAAIRASSSEIRANARNAAAQSGRMADTAVEGANAVRSSVDGIHRSYGEILSAVGAMGELKQASRSVGEILKIINEINDKTKLLALNAAIIASQSGEHGQSFGVVANEIKSLSDRTALSTGDISQIIVTIQERVDAAIAGVRRGEESLGGSVELVERAGTLLDAIQEAARATHGALVKINGFAERQTSLSETVDSAVAHVARMTEESRNLSLQHRRSGDQVDVATSAMGDLTEHLREAAREQAETSRYLSEAFRIINAHLRNVQSQIVAQSRALGENLARVKEAQRRDAENGVLLASLSDALDAVEQSRTAIEQELASPKSGPKRR